MFHLILRQKKLLQITTNPINPTHYSLFLLQQNPSLKSISNTSNINLTQIQTPSSSFTLSYLINSCELSPQSALSASQKIELKSAQNPDSVLQFFRNHGFTKTQITNLIAKRPRLLLANPNKTLMPKFHYFHGLGIPGPTLAKIFSWDYNLWSRSLQNQIIPSIDFIKACVRSNKSVVCCIQHSTHILRYDLQKVMEPNIMMLRDQGVPESRIVRLIMNQPRVLMQTAERLNEMAAMVKEMGFNPSNGNFILAIQVVSTMSRLKWEEKVAVYRSLGWSEDEFLSAFKVQPICMTTSEKKIKRVMNFFVKEMNWKPSDLSRCPGILMLSLEKRIIPRCSVLRILMSKDLIEKDSRVSRALMISHKAFLETFIIKNQESVPEILTVYQGKMGFLALSFNSEDADRALKL